MRSCFVPSTAMTKSPRSRAQSSSFSLIMWQTMSTSALSSIAVQPRLRKLQPCWEHGARLPTPSGQALWSASLSTASA